MRSKNAHENSPLPYGRRGVVLLEVIVALTILSVAALSAVMLANQASHAVQAAQAADTRSQHASAFLDAVSLWSRDDLDRHLGHRREGAWVLRIDRATPALYRVALYDSASATPLLETALFRPPSSSLAR